MFWHEPRMLLLRALLLDFLGQLVILIGILYRPGWFAPFLGSPELHQVHGLWLFFCLLLYPLLGWLFGSYTVCAGVDLLFLAFATFTNHDHFHFPCGCYSTLVFERF